MFLHTTFALFGCSDEKEETTTEQDTINTTEPSTEPSNGITISQKKNLCQ